MKDKLVHELIEIAEGRLENDRALYDALKCTELIPEERLTIFRYLARKPIAQDRTTMNDIVDKVKANEA